MQATILQGDVTEQLGTLDDESVHCVVTSPPYFSLRDYGCEGQIGLEASLDEYITKMVVVFRELRRVLRRDGTLFLNMGDSYACAANGRSAEDTKEFGDDDRTFRDKPFSTVGNGLKPKDLMGQPWELALALRRDGWWLRSDIIWHKPNPMPSSVTDRPGTSHEYLFLLAKSERYFFDMDAIREPNSEKSHFGGVYRNGGKDFNGQTMHQAGMSPVENPAGRGKRTVWTIPTENFKGAHFATYPRALVRPCILAGTSAHGCCPTCGGPWVRVVEKGEPVQQHWAPGTQSKVHTAQGPHGVTSVMNTGYVTPNTTIGWRQACRCPEQPPIPATVLDPFAGSGTTLAVALELGRAAIGIELNPNYCDLIKKRLAKVQLPLVGIAG